MDLRQIKYFVQVAELGSFTKAASVLDVAQPALSRQVRRLEIELRQNLLYRNGRGVSTTEAGKRLLAHGRGILLQFDRARQEVEEVRGTPTGRVVIGLPYSVARVLTTALAAEFQRQFPQASLCITEGLTVHLHEWLLAGRIDIALLHDPVPLPELDTVPLRADALFLIGHRRARAAPRGDSIHFKELAGLPLIIPSRPHPLRMMIETRLSNLGKKPEIAMEIDSVASIVDLVQHGYGHAVVTMNALLIAEDAAKLFARRIVAPRMSSVLALAKSAERPGTAIARRTATLIQDILAASLNAHKGTGRHQANAIHAVNSR